MGEALPSSPIHLCGSFHGFVAGCYRERQEVIQDFIPVLLEVGLEDGPLLLDIRLSFSASNAVGSQSSCRLGYLLHSLLLGLQQLLDTLWLTDHGSEHSLQRFKLLSYLSSVFCISLPITQLTKLLTFFRFKM